MTVTPHRSPAAPAGQRLRLKPPMPAAGFVDGGWWPRSTHLAAEVPGLAAALADRIGPLWRVAFAPQAWAVAGPMMISRGRVIRLEGFRSQDPDIVHVTGGSMRRLTLLIIPPQTNPDAAGRALSAAADPNTVARPESILQESGVWPRPRENDVHRWESEGGATVASADRGASAAVEARIQR